MRKIIKKKFGFTLVELIVVIAIVAVLSTLAINGYTQYRRSTLLDFSADSIISQLYEFRDKTIHGSGGREKFEAINEAIEGGEDVSSEDSISKCYGLEFGIEEEVSSFEKPYSNKKEWDPVIEDWEYEKCTGAGSLSALLEWDDAVSIVDIYDDEGFPINNFQITFVPPYGEVEALGDGMDLSNKKSVVLVIKYGESDEDIFKRKIFIDLKSGKSHVEQI